MSTNPAPYAAFTALRIERRGPQLWVILDNPPLNPMTNDTHRELSHVFRVIARDPDVRVVVLTGAGEKAFSAGGDINAMKEGLRDYERWVRAMTEGREIVCSVLECDKPIIARINGHAIGVGGTLALCCDITIMAERGKIGDTHVKIALTTGDGGALLWPHLVGLMKTRRYLMTGDLLTGREAADIGLITEAVPFEHLDERTNHWAERLANSAPAAIATTKRALNMALRHEAQLFMDAHCGLETYTKVSRDHAEAVTAFIEKRDPIFEGR